MSQQQAGSVRSLWGWLPEPWGRRHDTFERELMRRISRLEALIMASVSEIVTRLDAATNEIASDLQSVRDRLAAALADVDAAKQQAVDEALAQLDPAIARLEALGADPANPVPDPEVPANPDQPV